jgi:hypothetical protein
MVHILRDIAGRNFCCELASSEYGGCESATPLAEDDLKADDLKVRCGLHPGVAWARRGTPRPTTESDLFRGLNFSSLFVAKALDWV